eukprot:TRINITY_DN7307_c0_g4_i1.p2 TRINITY_DN7307_c0_g4~~TRINITY_DN7307_c0_g4_i1.p2  ORF type:complete len:129 (+),score=56.78 TRINITY_DN7307_c0_g4_i1:81-467(+)
MGACQCGTAEPEDMSRDIVSSPESPRPHIGVYMDRYKGNKIVSVRPGSAAAKAGLRAGDRIVSIDGSDVQRTRDVRRLLPVLEAKAAEKEKIQVRRRRKKKVDVLQCSVRDAELILTAETSEYYNKVH